MEHVGLTISPIEGAFNAVDGAIADEGAVTREAVLDVDWLSDGSSLVLYRLSGDESVLLERLADHDGVRAHEVTRREDDSFYLFVHAARSEPLSELLGIVEEHALLIQRPIEFVEEGIEVTVAGESGALREAFAEIPDTVDAEVRRTGEYVPGESAILSEVTERQREAMEAAVEVGYYRHPREATAEDVAERIGCSTSTASELLRRAEATIVVGLLGK